MPYRWRIVALLFFLSVINYLDRQALSVLAPSLRQQLDFTAVHYSYVVVSFLVAYTIGYFFCGNMIDRLGVRVAVTVALAAWSIAGMMHALAASWVAFAVCRFLLGLGESFNSPSGIKAITEWVPKRERGLCMALFSNGYIVGGILAPPLVSFIALRFGWQWAFIAIGGLGFVYLVFWLTMYRSPETHPRVSSSEREYILADRPPAHAQARISVFTALTHPLCLGFMFARLFTDSLSYFFSFWLPEYLQSARGFSLAMIGIFGWIPFLASDIGGPGGGALSDWLVRRGWNPIAARKRMLFAAACLMPASLIAVHADSAYVALGLIALLLAAQSCWNTNLLTLMSECFPREHVATYVSVAGIGGSIGGIISTLLAGQIIGAFGYVPVFTTLGFLHATAFLIILFFMRRYRRHQTAAVSAA